jgi:proteic killer suppression protein
LKRFIEKDDISGLPPAAIEKIRNIVSFLQSMADPDELRTIASWKAHRLTGSRRGTWSLGVTRNWRLTFRIEAADREIVDLDFEDYH